MKALETPEEKRARRLAKKEAKEKKRREKMGWSEEYMGYTNADNPFGDNNLLGTFKWQKVSSFPRIKGDYVFKLGFEMFIVFCFFLLLCLLRRWIRKASAISVKRISKKGTNAFKRRTAENCRRYVY